MHIAAALSCLRSQPNSEEVLHGSRLNGQVDEELLKPQLSNQSCHRYSPLSASLGSESRYCRLNSLDSAADVMTIASRKSCARSRHAR